MKTTFKRLMVSTLVVLLVVIHSLAFAQVTYKVEWNKSSVFVSGTSTIHDWEMKVEQLQASFELAEAGSLQTLKNGRVSVEVESIKSDRSLMNKKTYEALKSKKNPTITVSLDEVNVTGEKGVAKFTLSIAGKKQQISDDFTLESLADGQIRIEGELDLKMSSYDVEPPVALMGTIKTGDEVKIDYNLVFKQQ
ncbi:YceI family protein [Sunxiuqinia indica]|uniref:YceI family protein n=1 Tax=Sunxiuqinia indica TaxID=2692584 RepID=UPI00135C227C|nr:YceI family protein [Sunxiuqinia indica]